MDRCVMNMFFSECYLFDGQEAYYDNDNLTINMVKKYIKRNPTKYYELGLINQYFYSNSKCVYYYEKAIELNNNLKAMVCLARWLTPYYAVHWAEYKEQRDKYMNIALDHNNGLAIYYKYRDKQKCIDTNTMFYWYYHHPYDFNWKDEKKYIIDAIKMNSYTCIKRFIEYI